jgi:predicted XRE-type DNA-binding protein
MFPFAESITGDLESKVKRKKSRLEVTEEAAAKAAQLARATVLEVWECAAAASGDPAEVLLTQDQVIRELNERISATSQRKVAKAAGVPPSQLNTVLKGKTDISEPMARKFGYERRTVFVRRSEKG